MGWSCQRREDIGIARTDFSLAKIKEDVQAYVKTCHVCQVDKIEMKKEVGFLHPLPIPERP